VKNIAVLKGHTPNKISFTETLHQNDGETVPQKKQRSANEDETDTHSPHTSHLAHRRPSPHIAHPSSISSIHFRQCIINVMPLQAACLRFFSLYLLLSSWTTGMAAAAATTSSSSISSLRARNDMNSSLSNDVVRIVSKHEQQQKRLLQQAVPADDIKDFQPLTCNRNLASAPCGTWSSRFGTKTSHTERIIVPCGECIVMDHTATANLELLGGIDIIGKLVFLDGYKLNLSSTIIVVQGELQITSTKPVNGIPDIKFTMIGNDNAITFTPADVNTNACKGVSTCSVGKKGIIVAGGKVTSKLLPCAYRL
jgi:G8 domain